MSDIPATAARAAPEPTAAPGIQPPVVVIAPRTPMGDGLVAGAWDSDQADGLCGHALDALLIDGVPIAFLVDPGYAGSPDPAPGGTANPSASPELARDGLVRPVTVADAALLVEIDPSRPAS
jgi:hypothetical protein